MGEVYLAHDHSLGRSVAIKFLPEQFSSDPDRLARFAEEARATSSLNHPNVVTIHEIGNTEKTHYIVMEYVDGRTLRSQLKEDRPALETTLNLAVQLAEGLAKAHSAGIVHRDLKPENVMITPDGLLKILDFGLAKLCQGKPGDVTFNGNSTLATVVPEQNMSGIVGTIGYMSPEQASGSSVDFRSDQFSFGAILYEMATGRQAFERPTPVQTLSATIELDPQPVSTQNPSFPGPAVQVVERCLAKNPEARYSSTAELASELRRIRDQVSSAVTTGPPLRRAGIPYSLFRILGLSAAVIVGLLMINTVREGILGPLHLLSLPAEKRIAVLPFRYTGSNEDDRQLCDGILAYLTAKLGQLERFQKGASVVPALEVHEAGAMEAQKARRALGVTLAVDGTLQRVGGKLVMTASLIDTNRLRQLRATTVELSGTNSLLDDVVKAVISMLEVELAPEESAAFNADGTAVAEASSAYAAALSFTPYSQARTALERYEQEQNLERAITLFNEALRRDPNYALAHAGLGEAYWRISRFTHKPEQVQLAEDHCRRALSLDGTLAEVWITLGMLHTGTGKSELALEDLRHAQDRDPRNAAAFREMASAYRQLHRDGEADATYRKAIALQPESWITRSYYGSYLLKRGRPAEAEQQYREALKIVPDNARVWSDLGGAFYLQEKYSDAQSAWKKSLELHPTSTAASNLALHPFFEGRYAEAATLFERAVRIDDRDYRVWRNLADASYWTPGGRRRAAEAYQRAATLAEKERGLNPADPRVFADLADCYAFLNEPAKAREVAAEAIRLGGNEGQILFTVAGVYEQLGDRNSALRWLAAALKLGQPKEEIERDPGLEHLRADERYHKIMAARPRTEVK